MKLWELSSITPPLSEWSHAACQSDALVIFSEQHEQVASLLSTQHTVIAHLNLGYIRLGSLYLAREGFHLRCSINDAGLWMTHVDTKAMERFPTVAATLGINSRHHAGNTAESHTGPHVWRLHLYLKSVARVSSPESKYALILDARVHNSRIRHSSFKVELREMLSLSWVKKKKVSLWVKHWCSSTA